MAFLPNDAGALRLCVDLVDREAPVRGPVPVVTEDGRVPSGRLLGTVGVEYLDRRDGEWWPIVRLPAVYLATGSYAELEERLRELVGGGIPGFAWQSGEDAALGLQIGPAEPPGEGFVVEVGVDLSAFLAEAGGGRSRPGSALAPFRFATSRPAAVAFADALRREGGQLLG